MECFRLLFDHLAWIEHKFFSGIRDSRKAGSLWWMIRGVGGVRKSIHQWWTLDERYAIRLCFKLGKMPCDESWIYCYEPETMRQSSQWKHDGTPRPKKAKQSKSTHKLLMIPFFDSTGMIYMHWVPTGQTVNKEYYVEVLRESRKRIRRKRIRRKRPALFKSAQWHFHQDNGPIHNSIFVSDYLTKMGIKTVP